ncbi:MAG TPA: spherulation-specific family 4 protein [Streptosporangiaceae bacterium]|nr:spherulation-specific family 4 protein [Streptosporangiaceae bacterium]
MTQRPGTGRAGGTQPARGARSAAGTRPARSPGAHRRSRGWQSGYGPPGPGQRRPGRSPRRLPLIAGIMSVVIAATVAAAVLLWPGGRAAARPCRAAFVPAFFSAGGWTHLVRQGPLPGTMILDLTSSGAGSSPDPGYQHAVAQAQGAGIQVLGYVDTGYGRRPVSQVTAEARHYRAWYHVTGIFLDQVGSTAARLGYYRALAATIHRADPGAAIWLNPGIYPDPGYLAIATAVMVYEGPYAGYLHLRIPGWARSYPAARFVHNVYATPGSRLAAVVRLARARNAGHLYVTDRSGANPYDGVPGYWAREHAILSTSCAS